VLDFLAIRDFAVIADASVEFAPGFNVITGETGAGKSMIVSALDLLRGERAQSHFVRSGAASAVVEAQFHLENPPPGLLARLEEHGLQLDDSTLILERVIAAAGKGRQRIGGRLTTTGALGDVVPLIIEISSQHDSQRLLSAGFALQAIDDFGDHGPQVAELGRRLEACDRLAARREELETLSRNRDQLREALGFTIKELTEADLSPGEHERLLARRRRLSSLRDIVETARFAEEALSLGEGAVQDRLHAVIARLTKLAEAEPRFALAVQMLEEARIGVTEACLLFRMPEEDEEGGQGLEWIEERLFRLSRLLRKYHCEDEEALVTVLERSRAELEGLQTVEDELAQLARRLNEAREMAAKAARALSGSRAGAARTLSDRVTAELADLGFVSSRFFVELTPLRVRTDTPEHRRFDDRRLGSSGFDGAAFWFEPNPGQAPQPVGRGASGGELSRIHLALQSVLAGRSEVAVTLYDEVDAGIGGQIAMKIGQKLGLLSQVRQVLCITHLPQIAAAASAHFVVEKNVVDGQTVTSIRRLDHAQRVGEIARMLGGSTPEAVAHAASLLEQAAR
jgi:DNA repair protein RecN (Recombination protein N)